MRAYLQQWVYRIKGSYRFIPSLMVIAAIILSQFAIWLDHEIGNRWMKDFWFASMNQPDGARAFLATVAGSMKTARCESSPPRPRTNTSSPRYSGNSCRKQRTTRTRENTSFIRCKMSSKHPRTWN